MCLLDPVEVHHQVCEEGSPFTSTNWGLLNKIQTIAAVPLMPFECSNRC